MIAEQESLIATQRILSRCDELAKFSSLADGISRAYLTKEHAQANQLVASWMEQAGMTTWQDAVGNLWGKYSGTDNKAPSLILGSHLDTVPYAGRFDGILGVLMAIEIVADLHSKNCRLPFAIEVVGFGDEEGVRFGTAMIGSKAVAGQWQDQWLGLTDDDGVTLEQALSEFGLDPKKCQQANRGEDNIIGYWEVHIEQGPVLEAENLPIGVVTGIAGARRSTIKFTGKAGHSGTTPMHLRRDALAGAAEATVAIEKIAHRIGGDLVATVGQIFARPGAVNVIAGDAIISLDIRSQNDNVRDNALADIDEALERISARRNLTIGWTHNHTAKAVLCDTKFQQLFANTIEELFANNFPLKFLPSGAGHDAMAMAEKCPVAMLFLRSPGGISHHPDEGVVPEDVLMTLETLKESLLKVNKLTT